METNSHPSLSPLSGAQIKPYFALFVSLQFVQQLLPVEVSTTATLCTTTVQQLYMIAALGGSVGISIPGAGIGSLTHSVCVMVSALLCKPSWTWLRAP